MTTIPPLPIAFPSAAGPISWLMEGGDATVMSQSVDAWHSLTDGERAEIRVAVDASIALYFRSQR